MELRHLRYFVAVAEEGSMTRAADRLCIQQPPLGQQIKALEDELGVQLFDRQPRRISLNAAGAVFLQEALAVLAKAEEAKKHVRRFERGDRGHLTVGFTSSASLHPLTPTVLRTFRQTYPLAQIKVEENETYELILALMQNRIDAAMLRISAEGFDDLECTTLAEEELVVAVPVDHPFTKLAVPISLELIAAEGVVAYRRPDGPGIFDHVLNAFQSSGLSLPVVDEVYRIIAAINLVAAGRGIALVPASMGVLHPEAVAYLPLKPGLLPPLPLNVIHRKSSRLAIIRNFIALTVACSRAPFSELAG
jgi:DNA-binding transcriptional LysR family regulator